jgi:hypothetical protein
MTPRLSKFLLALEAIVLVAPITLLFSMVALEMLLSLLQFEDAWQFGLLSFVIIATSLVAGWSLMAQFWRQGRASFRTSSRVTWALALVGAFSTLIAAVLLFAGEPSRWPPMVKRSLAALVWGLPLLVPLGHLFAERLLHSAANKSLERTREG